MRTRTNYTLGSGPLPAVMPCGFERTKATMVQRLRHYRQCTDAACQQRHAAGKQVAKGLGKATAP
jgi:surface antigen